MSHTGVGPHELGSGGRLPLYFFIIFYFIYALYAFPPPPPPLPSLSPLLHLSLPNWTSVPISTELGGGERGQDPRRRSHLPGRRDRGQSSIAGLIHQGQVGGGWLIRVVILSPPRLD